MFTVRLPTAHRTLTVPDNRMIVEMFNENFKAKTVEINDFFHVD